MALLPRYVEGHNLLAGKSVLITAAAGAGIGFAAARKCVEEGCRAITISDIHEGRTAKSVEALKAQGFGVLTTIDVRQTLKAKLSAEGFRVEVDDRGLSMQKKIAEAQVQKIPFTLVIGDREVETNAVAPRRYGGADLKAMPFDEFAALFRKEASWPTGAAKPTGV